MLTAEDRYRHFLRRYPDLVGVLPQKDIGNYVGVTPVRDQSDRRASATRIVDGRSAREPLSDVTKHAEHAKGTERRHRRLNLLS